MTTPTPDTPPAQPSQPFEHPHFSAHICMQYLCFRLGMITEQLQRELETFFEFHDPATEFTPKGDKIQVTTPNYTMLMSNTGRIDNYQRRDRRRPRPQIVVEATQREMKKLRSGKPRAPRTAPAPQQPRDNSSAIVRQIQAEATARQPRVFVKKKKTMEPH